MISDGTFLYGMTFSGGTNQAGNVFKIKPDGTGYSDIFNFNHSNGAYPMGSLYYDGTFLYGMTSQGGANYNGVIFKVKPDGTGYVKLFDFNPPSTTGTDGSAPAGSLISDGTFLYGETYRGGVGGSCNTGCGTVFKIKPDGTGYVKLYNFINDANGSSPNGDLIYDGTYLYGMTQYGTPNGVLFKIKPDGTSFAQVLDFTGPNGGGPDGSLISDGTFLYGMTTIGGTGSCNGGCGTIFKIMPDGTGYSKLYDFTGASSGSVPIGTLILNGGMLYGMTSQGGANGLGVLFKINTDGTAYSNLLNFSGTTNGSTPLGSLVSIGGCLYGMTSAGGTSTVGVVFKYCLNTNIAENNLETGFNVYPNPCNGKFAIETKENNYMLTVTNILGEIIYQSKIDNSKSEINLSQQPAGIYFINIKTEQESFTQKLIISE